MLKSPTGAVVEAFMHNKGLTLAKLGKLSEINRGPLSKTMNIIHTTDTMFSMNQLDSLTEAMGMSVGSLYSEYARECIQKEKTDWRVIKSFLMSCAKIKRIDCIEYIIPLLAEKNKTSKQLPLIFQVAEEMYEEGYYEAAIKMYEYNISVESMRLSLNVAISYYKLLKMTDLESQKSFEIMMQFLPYRTHLPEEFLLDGLMLILNTYAVRNKWSEVEQYAEELRIVVDDLYSKQKWESSTFHPIRPLVYYYGQSRLYKSVSFEEREMLDQFKEWIVTYEDLSWFEGLNEEGKEEVEYFKTFANGNKLTYEIKTGNQLVIKTYIQYIQDHPDETVEALITLIESANKFSFFIDKEIEGFSNYFDPEFDPISEVKANYDLVRFVKLYKAYAVYCFRKNSLDIAIKNTLRSLEISVNISHNGSMNSSIMSMFDIHRHAATKAQIDAYSMLCRKVWSNENKDFPFFV